MKRHEVNQLQLFKLKIALLSIYSLGVSIHIYMEILTSYGYITLRGFLHGLQNFPFRGFYLFGKFEDLSGASPIYFLLLPLGASIFLVIVVLFWISWKKSQILIYFVILLALTVYAHINMYAYSSTPWWKASVPIVSLNSTT